MLLFSPQGLKVVAPPDIEEEKKDNIQKNFAAL